MGTMFEWKSALVVLKGVSKKNNKPYKLLAVDKSNTFNPMMVDLAEKDGVRVVDLTEAKS